MAESKLTIHNGDIVLASLRAIIIAENLVMAKALAQAAIDFATDDQEALAEGRLWADDEPLPLQLQGGSEQ